MILDSTLETIEAVLGGAITTNELEFMVDFADHTSSTFVPGNNHGATSGATPVTIVSAPAASTQRQIKYINFINLDTVDATLTIRLDDNGTERDLVTVILAPGFHLVYTDDDGWKVLDTNGRIQSGSSSDHGALTGLGDDDHTQYVLHTEVDDVPVDGVTTDPISSNWAFDHGAAADPHTDYRLESADHSHQSTGAQAGKLDHGAALDGLGDDDHTQYILKAIVDAKGDILGASADDTPVVTTVGINNRMLRANSGAASGISWDKRQYIQLEPFSFVDQTDCATGDKKASAHITAHLDGLSLVEVHAENETAGVTGTMAIQIRNVTQAVDILSTKLTIDTGETGSDTAAAPAVIKSDGSEVVSENDMLAIDVDLIHTTAAKGLIVSLGYA